MSRVVVYTYAYNAQATIDRAIQSIINQSHGNWIFYCVDNGSTDCTGEIIRRYAESDSRIIALANEKNQVWSDGNSSIDIIEKSNEEDYFVSLDADDEYLPDFFKASLEFIKENRVDIVACGSDFIESRTNQSQGARILSSDLIIEGEDFSKYFSVYHEFTRTIWGKVYPISLLRKFYFKGCFSHITVSYGGDTVFCLKAFEVANRVGILAGLHHKYYVSSSSVSYKFNDKRIQSDRTLDDVARQFLLDKCGVITSRNNHFIQMVYFGAIIETIDVLLNAQIPATEKLEGLHDIFTSEHTERLVAENVYTIEKDGNFPTAVSWILAQNENRKSKNAKIAAAILLAIHKNLPETITKESLTYLLMKIPDVVGFVLCKDYSNAIEQLQLYQKEHDVDNEFLAQLEITALCALNKPDDEIFDLLVSIKEKRPNAADKLGIDNQICELLAKNPMLKDVSAGLACILPRTVKSILKNDFSCALENFFVSSQNVEIDEGDYEAYILLGVNLSAVVENADAYIHFKKIWVSYLLDCLRLDEAGNELDEFEQILPGDGDFAVLRESLKIRMDVP